jgi:hypothetical protein
MRDERARGVAGRPHGLALIGLEANSASLTEIELIVYFALQNNTLWCLFFDVCHCIPLAAAPS